VTGSALWAVPVPSQRGHAGPEGSTVWSVGGIGTCSVTEALKASDSDEFETVNRPIIKGRKFPVG